MDPLKGREIIIEYHAIGTAVKVTAVDVLTMTEVSMQGPASAGKMVLQEQASKKLAFVLRKNGHIS